jgi:hypothetical protein
MNSAAPGERATGLRGAWLDGRSPASPRDLPAVNKRDVSSMSLVFIVAAAAALVGLAFAMQTSTYEIWGGLLIGAILLVSTVPIATKAARRWNDPKLGRVILLAAFVKLAVGSTLRYVVAYYAYSASDADRYYTAGATLAPHFRQGDFAFVTSNAGGSGTKFLEFISGLVIAVINESSFGEFIVFSWFSFIGLYLFYEAFRLAFPEGDHRRYRLLLFFWPSLLFWPSGVGKDAWMVWMLGMCALGIANLFIGRWRGFFWLGIGALGCIQVRPHVALIAMAGFALGLLLRRNRGTYSRMLAKPVGTSVLLVGIIIAGTVMFAQTQSFFNLESLDVESAQGVLASTTEQTAEGGSAFAVSSPNSPVGYAQAAVTVMFRPFPTEVSGTAFFTGLEGVMLAGLFVVSWRRLRRVLRMSLRNAYVAFAVGYTFVFIYAFSSISNFGILARERSQFFPVLFVLLAIPKRTPDAEVSDEIDDDALVAAPA